MGGIKWRRRGGEERHERVIGDLRRKECSTVASWVRV